MLLVNFLSSLYFFTPLFCCCIVFLFPFHFHFPSSKAICDPRLSISFSIFSVFVFILFFFLFFTLARKKRNNKHWVARRRERHRGTLMTPCMTFRAPPLVQFPRPTPTLPSSFDPGTTYLRSLRKGKVHPFLRRVIMHDEEVIKSNG